MAKKRMTCGTLLGALVAMPFCCGLPCGLGGAFLGGESGPFQGVLRPDVLVTTGAVLGLLIGFASWISMVKQYFQGDEEASYPARPQREVPVETTDDEPDEAERMPCPECTLTVATAFEETLGTEISGGSGKCDMCRGKGRTRSQFPIPEPESRKCSKCRGTGVCQCCGGTGWVRAKKRRRRR